MTKLNISKVGGSVKGEGHKRDKADRRRVVYADQFFMYESLTGWRVLVAVVEYKAPRKSPLPHIMARLKEEIQPD